MIGDIIKGCEDYVLAMNIIMSGITLTFILFLAILYFTKKNIGNLETKVYKFLLITTIVELSTFLIQYILDIGVNNHELLLIFLIKTRMINILYWYAFINLYRYIVVKEQDKNFENNFINHRRKFNIGVLIYFIVITIMGYAMPLSLDHTKLGSKVEIGGFTIYIAVLFIINILIYVGVLLYSRGKFDKKKFIPFIIIDIFMVLLFTIGNIFGELQIALVIRALVVYIMYHTLENPDVKMVSELTLAKNQAEQSNNAKSDFLSSMSHELRTPLNAIVGLSQLIEDESSDETVKNDAKDILVASENLLELVNGILDINKLEANELEKIEDNYNPYDMFNSLINMIKIRIGDKKIQLNTNISNTIPNTLYGDKDKLKRIISNLLTNSVKYTEQGQIDFIVDNVNTKDKCNLTITVKDTGRGISEEQKEKLFTKFNRLESDKDSDISGTGLGLAITKSLIDLLGGKITVESKLEEGSTFKVTITQTIVKTNEKTEIL